MSDKTTERLAPLPADPPDDEPMPGEWVECWSCFGDGFYEGDDPFWDDGVEYQCNICRGKGGWICEEVEAPGNAG